MSNLSVSDAVEWNPNITMEGVSGEKAFEIVLNSGALGISTGTSFHKEVMKGTFEGLQEIGAKGVILVYNQYTLDVLQRDVEDDGKRVFGENGIQYAPVYLTEPGKNEFGLRENHSIFSNHTHLREVLNQYPQHVMLASIPFSDPSDGDTLRQEALRKNPENIAARTMGTIVHNEKRILAELDPDLVGYLGVCRSIEDILDVLKGHENGFVLKKLGVHLAGGTGVFAISRTNFRDQMNGLTAMIADSIEFGAFERLPGINISDNTGKSSNFGHIRPIYVGPQLFGAVLKFPELRGNDKKDPFQISKQATANDALNGSSGRSNTMIVDRYGNPIFASKGKDAISQDTCFENLSINGVPLTGSKLLAFTETMYPTISSVKANVTQLIS